MNALCDMDGESIRQMLAVDRITSRQVMEASIKRIEALNPVLTAFVGVCFDKAIASADAADRNRRAELDLGPLAGLPVGVKDLNDVEGMPTTFGSALYAHNLAKADDDVVAAMRASGGIILGKTNVPEHGFGATTTSPLFGSSCNPFDPRLSAGASTGGGAVAVASGMVPYASGSDFAGSLRTPASFCGITGIRPSNGVVATRRRSMAWSSFDVEGPMARTAADCKRLLAAMSRGDRHDPLTATPDPHLFRPPEAVDLGGLRVAVSEDLGFAPMSRANRDLFRAKLAKFGSLFARVEEAHPDLGDAERTFMTLRGVGFVADFGPMEAEFGERLGPVVLDELARARSISAEDIGKAMKAHTAVFRRSIEFFEDHDILITPAAAVAPFPHEDVYPRSIDGMDLHGYLIWEGIAWGITLTQCPAVVIPCGRDKQGLPFAIQIVAPHHRDGWLLDVAHTLETAFAGDADLGRPQPDLSRFAQTET